MAFTISEAAPDQAGLAGRPKGGQSQILCKQSNAVQIERIISKERRHHADEIRNENISLTNEFRAEHDVAKLQTDELLIKAAQVRAEEMAATSAYPHPDVSKCNAVTGCPTWAKTSSASLNSIWSNRANHWWTKWWKVGQMRVGIAAICWQENTTLSAWVLQKVSPSL